MTERVVELPVQVPPEGLAQRLADLGTGRERLREDGLGVIDIEREDDRRAPDRRRREGPELGKLVGEMQATVADSQLDRHETSVRGRNPDQLESAECVAVEA